MDVTDASLFAPVTASRHVSRQTGLRPPGALRAESYAMSALVEPLLADVVTRLVALDRRLRLELPPTEPDTRWAPEIVQVPTAGNAVTLRLRYRLEAV